MAITGGGTSSNPWVIYNESDLETIAGSSSYWYGYNELGADIICSGNHTPIGNTSTNFTGHFDGKNHTITNLNVSGGGIQGLFGQCGGGFSIKNLKLVNGNATTTGSQCGMLIGYVKNATSGVVENIETDGCKVDANEDAGGIVGIVSQSSSGTMTFRNCYVHDGYTVASRYYAGGIAGRGANSCGSTVIMYENCYVENEYVCSKSNDSAGGIAGIGAISSSNVTYSVCEVRDCVVKGSKQVGGIAGVGISSSTAYYTNCEVYNTMVWSTSSGNVWAGGICGYSYAGTATITNPVVDGCTISASPYGNTVAGVCGCTESYATVSISNPTVRNCSIVSRSLASGVVNNK